MKTKIFLLSLIVVVVIIITIIANSLTREEKNLLKAINNDLEAIQNIQNYQEIKLFLESKDATIRIAAIKSPAAKEIPKHELVEKILFLSKDLDYYNSNDSLKIDFLTRSFELLIGKELDRYDLLYMRHFLSDIEESITSQPLKRDFRVILINRISLEINLYDKKDIYGNYYHIYGDEYPLL